MGRCGCRYSNFENLARLMQWSYPVSQQPNPQQRSVTPVSEFGGRSSAASGRTTPGGSKWGWKCYFWSSKSHELSRNAQHWIVTTDGTICRIPLVLRLELKNGLPTSHILDQVLIPLFKIKRRCRGDNSTISVHPPNSFPDVNGGTVTVFKYAKAEHQIKQLYHILIKF